MKNSKTPVTGIAETETGNYVFYLSDYSVKFMDTVIDKYHRSKLKSVDGFIQAKSHNNYKVLMYAGQYDIDIVNNLDMRISSYIVGTSNILDYDISYFDGLLFVGGTLSKLKHPNAMNIEYDNEQGKTYIAYSDDTQQSSFATDDFSCDVTIGSYTTEHHSLESHSVNNEKVYLEMIFDKPQKTESVYRHYNKLREILSFLTNRKNVGVEEIYLLHKDIEIGETKITGQIAQVFIRQEKELTQKHQHQNLEFECLEESVGKLFEIFYKTQDRKKSYSLGFYPETDAHDTLITNEIIRLVCSALECEVGFVKTIKNEELEIIKALKNEIKPIIDNHKKGPNKLKEKTYSLIESSMAHWSTAAADQFKILFHMYEEELTIANKSNYKIGDKEIDALVKYRNDITHGSYRILDPTIAYTTYIMECLIYCCFLTRIGVSRELIKQWFQEDRLLV